MTGCVLEVDLLVDRVKQKEDTHLDLGLRALTWVGACVSVYLSSVTICRGH